MDPREKRRQELMGLNRALLDKADQETRVLTDKEQVEFDEHMAEIKALGAQIKRGKELAELEGESRQSAGVAAGGAFIADDEAAGDPRMVAPTPIAGPLDYRARAVMAGARLGPIRPTSAANPWRSFGEFLQAVVHGSDPGTMPDRRLVEDRAAGLNENIGSEGGFLVTTDFSTQLLQRVYETGLLAGRTFRFQISGNANGIKIPYIVEGSRKDGYRWGGVRAYWQGEAQAKSETKPAFGLLELSLKKLTGLCYASDELIQDADALGAIVGELFSREFGFKTDEALVRGTGAGQPLGILNAPCLITVAAETGQVAATIERANIDKMWARMYAPCRPNSVWLINQDTEPQLNSLAAIVGTGGVPIYLPPGGLSASPFSTIYGRPVLPIEQASTLGAVGDITLADYSQYVMAEKGGMQAATSIHVRFLYDETTFRFVLRVDGQPWWQGPLTPNQGTNTLSPFVALAARA